ncbi:VCBS repeat-containing protein [bacterium]|nr:VCBS repeat-containing protein [bacterium]
MFKKYVYVFTLFLIAQSITTALAQDDKTDRDPYDLNDLAVDVINQAHTFSNAQSNSCSRGTLDGALDVDYQGQAHYDIPIELPPGSNGLMPSLSLNYSSLPTNGQLGIGWKIKGLSVITRCPATLLQDGFPGGIKFNQFDRYCLDGKRLVAVTGANGGNNARYRTNPDSFSLVTSHGITVGQYYGPQYFRVYTKDGMILEYGGNSSSSSGRIEAVGLPGNPVGNEVPIREWALSRIIDRQGKFIELSYGKPSTPTGEAWLTSIAYTGLCSLNLTSGSLPGTCSTITPAYNNIRFVYSFNRVDTQTDYQGGATVPVTALLTDIFTSTSGQLASQYKLSYELSNVSESSRLKAIQRCDANGICLNPTILTWSDDPNSNFQANYQGVVGSGYGGRHTIKGHKRFKDEWGFGFPLGVGVVHSNTPNYTSTSVMINAGVSYRFSFSKKKWEQHEAQLGDFNGDGKTDVVQFAQLHNREGHVSLSDGSTFVSQSATNPWGSGFGDLWQDRIGDFNGDGKSDVIQIAYSKKHPTQNAGHVWLSDGTKFISQGIWAHATSDPGRFILGDVNGDGRTDLLMFPEEEDSGYADVWLSSGSSFIGPYRWGDANMPFPSVDLVQVGDFDGDGMSDVIVHQPYTGGIYGTIDVFRSTGTNFEHIQGINYIKYQNDYTVIQLGDFNGDRLTDMMLFDYSPTQGDTFTRVFHSTGRRLEMAHAITDSKAIIDAGNKYEFRARLLDFNGDGRTDLLVFRTNGNADLYLSRDTNFELISNFGGQNPFASPIDEFAFGDVDGDGRADIIQFTRDSANSASAWFSNAIVFPDKLVNVRNGYGRNLSINYKPTSDDSIYTPQSVPSSAELYTREQRGSWYVVSQTKETSNFYNDQEQIYTHDYGYVGGKYNVSRGLLGFNKITFSDNLRRHRLVQTYNQKFPLTGTQSESIFSVDQLNNGSYTPVVIDSTSWGVNAVGSLYFRIKPVSNITTQYELNSQMKSRLHSNYNYDQFDNVVSQNIQTASSDFNSTITTSYSNNSLTWNLGLPLKITKTSSATGVTSKTETRVNQWNLAQRLLDRTTLSWNTAGSTSNLVNDFAYDSYGNILQDNVSGSNINPRAENFTFEPNGRFMTAATNALGHISSMQFDSRFGALLSYTDPNGLVSSYSYDGFGRSTGVFMPDNTSIAIDYCAFPQAGTILPTFNHGVSIIQTGRPKKYVQYDILGRAVRTTREGFDGTLIFKDNIFDNSFRLVRMTDPYYQTNPNPPTFIYGYDILDRINLAQDPNGASSTFSWAAPATNLVSNPIVTTNGFGQVIEQQLPQNHIRQTIYNDIGQVIQVKEIDATNSNLVSWQSYKYDAGGNLYKTANAKNNITTIDTDDFGLRLSLSSPDSGLTTYRYNVLGELLQENNSRGLQINYGYDLLGRLVSRVAPDGATNWQYDISKLGTLESATSPSGDLVQLGYDNLTRLTTIKDKIQSTTYTRSYGYDSAGRMNSITYPGTPIFKVGYGYNARGYIDRVFNAQTNANYASINQMTALDELTNFTYGNGVVNQIDYDAITGEANAIKAGKNSTTAVQYLDYAYDNIGRVIARNDNRTFTFEPFQYDILDRLTLDTSCNLVLCWYPTTRTYDEIGNLQTKEFYDFQAQTVEFWNYQYSPTQPHAVTAINTNTGTKTFSYDAAGNMNTGNGRNYAWDSRDLPLGAFDGTSDLRFRFNAFEEKSMSSDALNPSYKTIHIGELQEETVTSETFGRDRYIYLGNLPIATHSEVSSTTGTKAITVNYLHHDNIGSITAKSNLAGNLAQTFTYKPFGAPGQANNQPNRKGFTGHRHLGKIGLIDMRARMFDPEIEKFVSSDKLVPDPFNTQSYNQYSYVNNNPLNLIDPTGHFDMPPGDDQPKFQPTQYNVPTYPAGPSSLSPMIWSITVSAVGVTQEGNYIVDLNPVYRAIQTYQQSMGTVTARIPQIQLQISSNFFVETQREAIELANYRKFVERIPQKQLLNVPSYKLNPYNKKDQILYQAVRNARGDKALQDLDNFAEVAGNILSFVPITALEVRGMRALKALKDGTEWYQAGRSAYKIATSDSTATAGDLANIADITAGKFIPKPKNYAQQATVESSKLAIKKSLEQKKLNLGKAAFQTGSKDIYYGPAGYGVITTDVPLR